MHTLTFPMPTTGNTRTDMCDTEWCAFFGIIEIETVSEHVAAIRK